MEKKEIKLLKIIEHKLKSSKIAPAEKAILKKLKTELKAIKRQARALKLSIRTAHKGEKIKLIGERRGLKKKCMDLKNEIRLAAAKLLALKRKFKHECVEKLHIRVARATSILKSLKPQLKDLKNKLKELKETLKYAKGEQAKKILRKINEKKELLKSITITYKMKTKFLAKAKEAENKLAKRKIKHKIHKRKHILNVLLKELKSIKHKEAKFLKRISKLKVKLGEVKQTLRNEESSKREKKVLKKKIRKIITKIKRYESKLKYYGPRKVTIKNEIKKIQQAIFEIDKTYKEMKAKSKCIELQKKLIKELMKAKKLKNCFSKVYTKAVKTQKKKHIKKVLKVKKCIDKIQKKIEKTKKKIRCSGRKQRKELVKKEEALEKKLRILRHEKHNIEVRMVMVTGRLRKEKGKTEIKDLKDFKIKLIGKVAEIEKKKLKYKNQLELLRESHKKNCAWRIKKEKKLSKEMIEELKWKLEISKKLAFVLRHALEEAKKLTKLRKEAARLKRQALEAESGSLKEELNKKAEEFRLEITKKAELERKLKRRAIILQKELEQKTQMQT